MDPTDNDNMAAVARDVLGMPNAKKYNPTKEDAIFRGFFGAPIPVIVLLWNMIAPSIDANGPEPKHLLWAMVFLMTYSTTFVHCRIVGWVDPKTFRKWSWYFIRKVSSLKDEVIKLDNRFEGFDGTNNCLLSVDCFDCMIFEPWPFEEKWYSQKHNGPGVKYELGVCIKTGLIVWLNGPFPTGKNDATICKDTLLNLLADDEGIEVDSGYKGDENFKSPITASSRNDRKQKSVMRGRHENIKGRLKVFSVLSKPFRHNNPRMDMMKKHKVCTEAVVVITELKLENGEGLFDVPYDVSYN